MAVKPILKIPNPILNTKCERVAEINDETKQLVTDLLDTLTAQTNPQGTGLAAPQIGVLKRVCIVRRWDRSKDDKETFRDYVLINPEILGASSATDIMWEACLSIPDLFGKVIRNKRVRVTALNEDGKEIKIKASGFFARVIQHEVDHLNGILFNSKIVGEGLNEAQLDAKFQKEEDA